MKVRYFCGTQTGLVVTAVFDHQTAQWSAQVTVDSELGFNLEKSGFVVSAYRAPTFLADRAQVGYGTGGQRVLLRKDKLKAECWTAEERNGLWGGTLLVWGANHLDPLLKIMRNVMSEKLADVQDSRIERSKGFLLTHFVRTSLPHQTTDTLLPRMKSILTDGLASWNVRVALWRMRGDGMPVGDQMSSDCITGGFRYNFFNMSYGGCFTGSPVCIVPKKYVIQRSSCRYYSGDSGSNRVRGSIHDSPTIKLFEPLEIPSTSSGEFLIHGHVAPSEMVVLTSKEDVAEECERVGVDFRFGWMSEMYRKMKEEQT